MISGKSNQEIQLAILEAIKQHRASDPLSPVSLIVSNPSQGWLLRRQLAEKVGVNKGLANVQIFTASEFLAFCLRLATGQSISSENRIVQSIEAEKILETETGDLAPAKMHTGTLQLMLNLADEIQWCELNETLIEEIEKKSTNTSAASLRFVQRLRNELEGSASLRSWDQVSKDIEDSSNIKLVANKSGLVMSLTTEIPSAVRKILDSISAAGVQKLELDWPEGNEKIDANSVYSCPSPSIEAKIAAQKVAQWIAQGISPSDIAVVSSSSSPYSNLLAAEFDAAKIEFNGSIGTTLASRDLPRVAILIAEMAAARAKGEEAITRFRFMRWISATQVSLNKERVSPRKIRKLIQEENLYSEANNWIKPLTALKDMKFGEDEDKTSFNKKRNALQAPILIGLIQSLDETINKIAQAKTWAEAGQSLYGFIDEFHTSGNFLNQDEQGIKDQVRGLLLSSLGELTDDVASPAKALPQLLTRQFQGRSLSRGVKSAGIHIGTINSTQLLSYKRIVLLGAGEGLLPSVRANNPLLPEEARNILRGEISDNLPSIAQKILREITNVNWLLNSAEESVVTYPRGGHSNISSGRPSSLLNVANQQVLQSAIEAISEFDTANEIDIEIRRILSRGAGQHNYERHELAAQLWWRPEFSELFGHVKSITAEDFENIRLSSSGLETFISCPHKYFVGRVLQVRSDQFVDDIDAISAADFGTLLHEVFEDFYLELEQFLRENKDLPSDSIDKIKAIFAKKSSEAITKGFVGWLPAWEHQHKKVEGLLQRFLGLDKLVRENGKLIPVGFEKSFNVEMDVDGSKVILNGFIDRVDIANGEKHVSVIDYKSGSSDDFNNLEQQNLQARKKLQDLVYDKAARILYPNAEKVDVKFLFFPNKSKLPEVIASPEFDRETLLNEVLLEIKNSFVNGEFPIQSPSDKYCPVCKFYGRRAFVLAKIEEGDEDESSS